MSKNKKLLFYNIFVLTIGFWVVVYFMFIYTNEANSVDNQKFYYIKNLESYFQNKNLDYSYNKLGEVNKKYFEDYEMQYKFHFYQKIIERSNELIKNKICSIECKVQTNNAFYYFYQSLSKNTNIPEDKKNNFLLKSKNIFPKELQNTPIFFTKSIISFLNPVLFFGYCQDHQIIKKYNDYKFDGKQIYILQPRFSFEIKQMPKLNISKTDKVEQNENK